MASSRHNGKNASGPSAAASSAGADQDQSGEFLTTSQGLKFYTIHAAKPHPDREIPQAQSAHDTFWDFASLPTKATHHLMWNMSDRGIPRFYRTMEGFGVPPLSRPCSHLTTR